MFWPDKLNRRCAPAKFVRVLDRPDQARHRGPVLHVQIDRVGGRRVTQREQRPADEPARNRRIRIGAVRIHHDLAAGNSLAPGGASAVWIARSKLDFCNGMITLAVP